MVEVKCDCSVDNNGTVIFKLIMLEDDVMNEQNLTPQIPSSEDEKGKKKRKGRRREDKHKERAYIHIVIFVRSSSFLEI